jgi:hypothetical protein
MTGNREAETVLACLVSMAANVREHVPLVPLLKVPKIYILNFLKFSFFSGAPLVALLWFVGL